MKILILGGVKSGKSRLALKIAKNFAPPRLFVATAEPFDAEMQEKIKRHQKERGPSWQTLEAPLELCAALEESSTYGVCLVDCLTVWLGNLFYYQRPVDKEVSRLVETVARVDTNLIFVSNEVGLGVLPGTKESRVYVDSLGLLNQELAKLCDRVYLVVAGLLLPLKP